MFIHRRSPNRTEIARRAIILAAAILGTMALTAPLALADTSDEEDRTWTALFDLGVDISLVSNTPAEVQKFLSTFAPQGQAVLMNTCEHYLQAPNQAARDTINFCRTAMSISPGNGLGSGDLIRTFGIVAPNASTGFVQVPPAAEPRRHRGYTLDPDAPEFWDWGN